MLKPRTQPIETQISAAVAVAHNDRTMALDATRGQFSAADKRRIVAALRGCDPADVDLTARECVVELAETCGFDAGTGSRTRLTKAEKQAIKAALVAVGGR